MVNAVDRLTSNSFRSGIVWYNVVLYLVFLSRLPWGVGITLFEVLHLLPYLVISKHILGITKIKIIIAVLISIFFWIRADFGFQFVGLVSLAVLNYFIFYEIAHKQPFRIEQIATFAFQKINNVALNIWAMINPPNIFAKAPVLSDTSKRIIAGFVVSIPIIFILLTLFSSADATFESWTKGLWEVLGKIMTLDFLQFNLFHFIFTGFFFGVYLLAVIPSQKVNKLELKKQYIVELLTLSSIVILIFGAFLVSQFNTVQAIVESFRNATLNPREFVREGFYQMSFAVVIAFGVLYLVNLELLKKLSEKLIRAGKYLAGILLLEVILVILLAFQRVWAYQYAYGFTQLRLWGIFLVIWLLGLAMLLGGRIFKILTKTAFLQTIIIFSSSLVLLIGIVNIDHTIADIKPPIVNGKTDYYYIGGTLSYDAAPVWAEMLSDVNDEEQELARALFSQQRVYYSIDEQNKTYSIYPFNKEEYYLPCSEVNYSIFGYNLAVERGKKIVCDNIENWMAQYEQLLDENYSRRSYP